jgi:hypothetical protein
MSPFDAFCLRMIPICLVGAALTGLFEYHIETRDLTVAAHRAIPGCASGKYTCTVRYEHGKPLITMAMENHHEKPPR